MDVHTLRDVYNELDVGVVVVVGTTGDFNVVIRHADVVCVGLQILGGSHDGEMDGALVAKCFVRPFPDRTNLFDGGDTVVCDENLPTSTQLLRVAPRLAGEH